MPTLITPETEDSRTDVSRALVLPRVKDRKPPLASAVTPSPPPPLTLVPAIHNYVTDVLPHLIAPSGQASSNPAWNGVFDHFIAGSFSPVNYYFLGQSIIGKACAADETLDYPGAGWQDNDFYAEIFWSIALTKSILSLTTVDGFQIWVGQGATATLVDPSGVYIGVSGPSVVNLASLTVDLL